MSPTKIVALLLCAPIWSFSQAVKAPKKLLPTPVIGGGTGGLTLAAGWDNPLGMNKVMGAELLKLLKPFAPPSRDVSPAPDLEIYPGVTYLMKLQAARVALGKGAAVPLRSTAKCLTSGFPAASMSYHDTIGDFEDDFGHVLLVTDAGGCVTMLQFMDNTPKKSTLSGHNDNWSTFNFVQTRRKGVSSYKIANKAKDLGKVIQLDSELIDANGYPRERVRLYIPKKFASIVVAILESSLD
jgi:hypothetical protein